jgi:predicted esterase
MPSTSRALRVATLAALLVGCGGGGAGTGGAAAGASGSDASTEHPSAPTDAGHDGTVADAGHDGTVADAGHDGAVTDAGHDGAVTDAGHDGAPADAAPSSTRQTARLKVITAAPNSYLEYVPPGYDGQTPLPLLLFWHGIGEDGSGSAADLQKLTAWGPPKLIANDKWDNARPFIVLSPQYTPTNGNIAPGGGCPSSKTIDDFLVWALGHYEVDPKRIYLTGLSCGAIGSWDYLAEHQGATIAAAVLLSGNPGDPTQAGSAWMRARCMLATAAIWSFHGDADGTVPYAPDHDTVADLAACPSPPRRDVTFTDIAGGGHTIWDPIYDLSGGKGDIYAWMLAHAKP